MLITFNFQILIDALFRRLHLQCSTDYIYRDLLLLFVRRENEKMMKEAEEWMTQATHKLYTVVAL